MAEKKVTIYIKANPSSMGYLQKLEMQCDKCEFYSADMHPCCFEDKSCVVYEYMYDKLAAPKPQTQLIFSGADKNNLKISAISQNINALRNSYEIAERAIGIALGNAAVKHK